MLDVLTWRQIAEWAEFYQLEPFGFLAADLNTARIQATLANTVRDPKTRPHAFSPHEFMVTRPEPEVDDAADPLAAFDDAAMRAGLSIDDAEPGPVHAPEES